MQLLSLGKNPLASLFLAVVPPNSEGQVECARITTKTLEQTVCPLVECAAVSIEGRGEKIGQRLLFLEWSRVIRILMRELIINVIIGPHHREIQTGLVVMVPFSRLAAKIIAHWWWCGSFFFFCLYHHDTGLANLYSNSEFWQPMIWCWSVLFFQFFLHIQWVTIIPMLLHLIETLSRYGVLQSQQRFFSLTFLAKQ
jgi:hypothetical protein